MAVIYLAGGCFWGMERLFRSLPGVTEVTAGYANGDLPEHACYEIVCTGATGFREAVRVEYDPAGIPLEHLLFAFFASIDTETPYRQGPDIGSQYQSGVYWADKDAEEVVRRISGIEAAGVPCFAVELKPLASFFPAEAYHQRYLEKHPGGYCHVGPGKLAALSRYPFRPACYTRPAALLLREWREKEGL